MEQSMSEWINNHLWFRWLCGIIAGLSVFVLLIYGICDNLSWLKVICGCFFAVVGLYACFFEFFTKENREKISFLFSFSIALIGIFAGVSDNSAFTQSDGNWKKVLNRIFTKEKATILLFPSPYKIPMLKGVKKLSK